MLLPAKVRSNDTNSVGRRWWGLAGTDTWVHLVALGTFLGAMWWHAGQFALAARLAARPQFIGGEGWYLNVLVGSTTTVLAVAARERYGRRVFTDLAAGCAAFFMVWNLVARVALGAFWGGGVRLWSGFRFADLRDVVVSALDADRWRAWQSWPGVTGPWWLAQALPLLAALAVSVGVLWGTRGWPRRRRECTM